MSRQRFIALLIAALLAISRRAVLEHPAQSRRASRTALPLLPYAGGRTEYA